MKTNTLTAIVGLAFALGLTTGNAAAFGRGKEMSERWKEQRKERMERRADALGLTEAQREQIRAIHKENLPALKPLLQAVATERRALRDAMAASPLNEAAIRAQTEKVASATAELNIQRARVMARIREVLTPEQREQIKERRAKAAGRAERRLERLGSGLGAE